MIRILLTIILLSNVSFAVNLHGKIVYNEQSARIEAFKDLERKIPKEMFKNYSKDKYAKENIQNIRNKIYVIDKEPKRNINPFYVSNKLALYSVEYEDDINKKYYYNLLGHLVKFEINDYSDTYPYKAIAYDRRGNVKNITLVVSDIEAFIFDKNEKLLGHWSDNKFFDKNGKESYQRILK